MPWLNRAWGTLLSEIATRGLVELVHRSFDALCQKAGYGLSYLVYHGLHYYLLVAREVAEYVADYCILADGLLFGLRSADSHPESSEISASQR